MLIDETTLIKAILSNPVTCLMFNLTSSYAVALIRRKEKKQERSIIKLGGQELPDTFTQTKTINFNTETS